MSHLPAAFVRIALVVLLAAGARSVRADAPPLADSGGAPSDAAEPAPEGPAATPPPTAPPAAAPEATAAERARALFREGMTAFDEHRYHDAIAAFRRASELVPSADLSFNVARAYEELREYEGAVEYYRRYLRDRVDPPDRERVEEHIRELEERAEAERLQARQTPTTGTLRVDVNLPGAVVRIDGRSIGTSPVALPLSYGAGAHEVDVRREGYIPFRARVRVEPGSSVVAVANLERATEFESVRGRRRWTWVMAGLGGASLVASAVFGGLAVASSNDGDRSEARRLARYSDYATGGALVFGVGTVTLYFAEGRSLRSERLP